MKGSGIAVVCSGHTTTWGLILSLLKVIYLLQVNVTADQHEMDHSESITLSVVYIGSYTLYRWYLLQANVATYEH